MALFNRQKSSDVPVELQPYYDAPRSGPRSWLLWVVRIVALVIVIGALITAGHWGWQKIVNNDEKVGISTSQQSKATAKPKSSSSSDDSNKQSSVTPSDDNSSTRSTSTPSTATTPDTASQAAPTATDQTTASPSVLANTGPGETIALFGLASIVGVVLYQSYLRLKKPL